MDECYDGGLPGGWDVGNGCSPLLHHVLPAGKPAHEPSDPVLVRQRPIRPNLEQPICSEFAGDEINSLEWHGQKWFGGMLHRPDQLVIAASGASTPTTSPPPADPARFLHMAHCGPYWYYAPHVFFINSNIFQVVCRAG